ncbi:MAG: DsbA family oxidoreductase [Acidimicrobiales bacterium]
MRVDVWSDVVCPWCFIGLANLEQALAGFEHADEVDVVLHSFELDPNAPRRDDTPLEERLARKYGSTVEDVRVQQERITALGAERDIEFRFDRAVRGSSFDAHRLLHLARERGVQLALKHRLGRAYFTDGEALGEHDTLRKAAADVGLDPIEVDDVLGGDRYAAEVRQDEEAAHQIGVAGVPFFVIDGRFGLPGAQPADALWRSLERTWPERATGVG